MKIDFAYFGGEPLAVPILKILLTANIKPSLVICSPDKPVGRKKIITPPPLKKFAQENNLPIFQPHTYKNKDDIEIILNKKEWDLFVVVAYNFILPAWLLNIPKYGVINVHPSLLPKLRGASPIRTAIKENLPETVGVTIMRMTEGMDEGPILKQEKLSLNKWPVPGPELDESLANLGGELLKNLIPDYVNSKIKEIPQNQDLVTYCHKIKSTDREVRINPHKLPIGDEAVYIWCAINAYIGIGDAFFVYDKKRVKINSARLTDDKKLILTKVTPAGRKPQNFSDYLSSIDKI